MTLTSVTSANPAALQALQPAVDGELNPRAPHATARDKEELGKLITDVREAALDPAALQSLAYAIASQEGVPGEARLAYLQALLGATAAPAASETLDVLCSEAQDELREAEEQEARDLAELRKQAEETRDHLRRALLAMETLRTHMRADVPYASRCARIADAWQTAIAAMDDLLQPSLETRVGQDPREIARALTTLCANLRFQVTALPEPENTPGLMPLA